MTPATEKKLTATELAEALGVSPSTVYRLKQAGRLPCFQPGGKHHFIRFPESLLQTVTEATPDSTTGKSMTHKAISGPTPKWLAENTQR